jgi:type II secretory pathway component PulM
MKTYFKELEKRDQIALSVGVLVLALFILYQFIWTPFNNALTHMQKELVYQENLLSWMENAKTQLTHRKTQTHLNTDNLLSETSAALKRSRLEAFNYDLQQADGDNVRLVFNQVPYIKFLQWMTPFWKKNALELHMLSIKPLKTPGTVKLSLIYGAK